MKHETTWWRPDGWFRLIYGVWANQLWYWQHVRPLLDDPQQRKRIFVQAVLGTLAVALALSLIPIYILAVAGTKASVPEMLAGALLGWIIATILETISVQHDPNAVAYSIFLGMGLGLLVSVNLSFRAGFSDGIVIGFVEGAGLGFAVGLAMGIGYGVRTGLVKGTDLGTSVTNLLWLAPAGAALCFDADAFEGGAFGAALIASVVFAFPAAYLGYRWAIRQVPDEQTRKQLANPEGDAESR